MRKKKFVCEYGSGVSMKDNEKKIKLERSKRRAKRTKTDADDSRQKEQVMCDFSPFCKVGGHSDARSKKCLFHGTKKETKALAKKYIQNYPNTRQLPPTEYVIQDFKDRCPEIVGKRD